MKKKHYNIPIFLPHAACPFRCVFCDQHIITSQLHIPTPQEVRRQLQTVLSTLPQENSQIEAAFFGGNFTALPQDEQQAYLETVQPFLQTGQIHRVRCSTRPDCIEPEHLEWLKTYGVEVIELGIQSFDEEVLRATGRGYTAEQAQKACKDVKKAGILLGVQLMPGLPEDTREKSVLSAKAAVWLQADMARIYPTVVLKGTPLENMMQKGRYQPLDMETAIEVSKDMRLVFEAADIPVIRLGLYAGEDLQNPENVCGGAFHPAFGERVAQRVFLDQACTLLDGCGLLQEAELILFVNRRNLSKMTGWKRENLLKLTQRYQPVQIRITGIEHPETDWVGVGRRGALLPEKVLSRRAYLQPYSL